jgi:hypothetical protein
VLKDTSDNDKPFDDQHFTHSSAGGAHFPKSDKNSSTSFLERRAI